MEKIINLRIPHVAEQIFRSFDTDTVVQCLEVSRSWIILTKNVLMKRQDRMLVACKSGKLDILKQILSHDHFVEENVLIAAGAVVLEIAHLESGFIYGGVPAKKIKALSSETFNGTVKRISDNYILYSSWFKE